MTKYTEDVLQAAHKTCFKNRTDLEASDKCGCFSCGRVFVPTEINEWVDGDTTAVCPHCHVDAVIASNKGFPLDEEFLMAMNDTYFGFK